MFKLKEDEFREKLKTTNFTKDDVVKIQVAVYMGFFGAEIKLSQEDLTLIAPIQIDENKKAEKEFYQDQADGGVKVAHEVCQILTEQGFKVVKTNFE